MNAVEIRIEICAVCSQNVMSEGTVSADCKEMGEQTIMVESKVVGLPSV
jgi:predicted RNA-binding Zn-ribbon protein involved in translation (DUF1610 family)